MSASLSRGRPAPGPNLLTWKIRGGAPLPQGRRSRRGVANPGLRHRPLQAVVDRLPGVVLRRGFDQQARVAAAGRVRAARRTGRGRRRPDRRAGRCRSGATRVPSASTPTVCPSARELGQPAGQGGAVDQFGRRARRVVALQQAGGTRRGAADVAASAVAVRRARGRCPRALMAPGRSTTGAPRLRSTMVDSRPTRHGPPSRISGTASPNSARTCAAVVGLMWPKRLADGAAMPLPNARSRASASGWSGTRRATVSCPPVTALGTRGAARQDQRQRAGPEGRGERPRGRPARRPPSRRAARLGRQVDDQRVLGRPALEGKDARHGGRVQRIGAQAVDGLGGQRHHLPGAQQFDRLGDECVGHGVSRSMCAARMKSLRLRPPTECVHRVISTRPQASSRSG